MKFRFVLQALVTISILVTAAIPGSAIMQKLDHCNDESQAKILGVWDKNGTTSTTKRYNNSGMGIFMPKLRKIDADLNESFEFSEINLSPESRGTRIKIQFVNLLLLVASEICRGIDLEYLDIIQGLTSYSLAKLEVRYHKLDFLYFKATLSTMMKILEKCWRNRLFQRNPWMSTDIAAGQKGFMVFHIDLLDREQYENTLKFETKNRCKDVTEYLESVQMQSEMKHAIYALWQIFKINYIGCSDIYNHRYVPARFYVLFQTLILNPLVHAWRIPDMIMVKTARDLQQYDNVTQSRNKERIRKYVNSLHSNAPMDFVPCFEVLPKSYHIPL